MLEAKAIGRLVANPQIHSIIKNDTEYTVCEFRLACQQKKDKVDFIKVTAWRGMGDFIFKNVKKGQKIYIGGALKIPPYDKEKGHAYEPYIVTYNFEFCDSKSKEPKAPDDETAPNNEEFSDTINEDDLI
jgi:single-stranded DNA-binding protein